jgi:hypothetical protein
MAGEDSTPQVLRAPNHGQERRLTVRGSYHTYQL